MFTNPPPALPHAAADLISEFSADVEKEIVCQINAYGRIKSGVLENVEMKERKKGGKMRGRGREG